MSYISLTAKSEVEYHIHAKRPSLASAFFKWAADQDGEHHIAWTGICLLVTTAVFFPLTMAAIVLNGVHFPLLITAMVALVMVVVLNLAAMPTRYTIPAFVLGILIDAAVIITSILY